MPFSTTQYPFYVEVKARRLPAWGYWENSKITAAVPPSPVDCSGGDGASPSSPCGATETLKLVPFGGTNIRMAVLPWFKSGGT